MDVPQSTQSVLCAISIHTGPCDPREHYTVMRKALIARGKDKVEKGRYFTIFALRQSGKTTYFQLLIQELKKEAYTPIGSVLKV